MTVARRRLRRYGLSTAAPRTAYGFRSEWTSIGGARVHARVPVAPTAGAPQVVLVHGLAVSHRYLMPTADVLARRGYGVRVLDLPGFGLSDDPGHVLDVAEHADRLAAWIERNALDPAVLLGNSFGCQVVVDLAVRHPSCCAGLVLSGPTVDPTARSAARQTLRWLWDLCREDPMQLPFMLRDIRDAGPARVLRTFRAALRDRIEAKLPVVAVPTLVLRGEKEPIVPTRWARDAAKLAPDAVAAVVPGSPHNAVYVAAEPLVDLMEPFLRRVTAPPDAQHP